MISDLQPYGGTTHHPRRSRGVVCERRSSLWQGS
uniref:Uncharacterized protein n=1 Tax=Anopheles arabiensis TaxID=7173 RepID=A0A182IH20_ANOAR